MSRTTKGLGHVQRGLLAVLAERPLFKREIASWLHHGVAEWDGWHRPKQDDFVRAGRLVKGLVDRGLVEWRPYGDKHYRLHLREDST